MAEEDATLTGLEKSPGKQVEEGAKMQQERGARASGAAGGLVN